MSKQESQPIVDHLFRHQYGKMVAALTRVFGPSNLEVIEDAVQDTFIKVMVSWRSEMPDNPEGWLMTAAKNRSIDIFRKLNAEQKRVPKIESGIAAIALNEVFLDNEIADSQLRMIFMACHPSLNPRDQIAFALKTISGFSSKEIASALLLKDETIKKRLVRARKSIASQDLAFQIPQGTDLPERLNRVLEVLYLIFNEGFHSGRKEILVRKDLCGEAIRLCKMLLGNPFTRSSSAYALFALMCFHSSRLESKVNEKNEIVDLKNQDRTKWYRPLMILGDEAMYKAVENDEFSTYHFEAAIAAEHLKAKTFEDTNWTLILNYYKRLFDLQPSVFNLLNIAIVKMQLGKLDKAFKILEEIKPTDLEQRAYLYFGAMAEYFTLKGENSKAVEYIDSALELVRNQAERDFLLKKKKKLTSKS